MYNHKVTSKWINSFEEAPIEVIQSLCKNCMDKENLCLTQLTISERLFIGKILYDIKESGYKISILTARHRLKEVYWDKWHYAYSLLENRIKAHLNLYPYNDDSVVIFIMERVLSLLDNPEEIQFDERLTEDLYLMWLQE